MQCTFFTSLHLAASEGYAYIVKIFIQYGARNDSTNFHGETALDLAKNNNYTGIIRLLNIAMNIENDDSISSSVTRTIFKSAAAAVGGIGGSFVAGGVNSIIGATTIKGVGLASTATIPIMGPLAVGAAIIAVGSYMGSSFVTKTYKAATYDSDYEKEENLVEQALYLGAGAYGGKVVTDRVFGQAKDYGSSYTLGVAQERAKEQLIRKPI